MPQRSPWRSQIAALLLTALLAGLGALALRAALDAVTMLVLGRDGSGLAPAAATAGRYGSQLAGALGLDWPWLLPLCTATGMMLAAILARTAGSGAAGTDGIIAAINSRETTAVTVRGAAVKLAGTAVTVGSGGSAGTEGPVAHIGAALGAFIARRTRLTPHDSALLVAAGLAGGVGALFQAPIGGALLAAELLRRRGAQWQMLLPALLVAPGAFAVYCAVHGSGPMFAEVAALTLGQPHEIVLLALTGVCCGLLARLYVLGLFTIERWLRPARRRCPLLLAAAGGAAVGGVGLVLPMALGTGYGTICEQVSTASFAALPLWAVLALPFAKILTTAITLGAGGIGGVFGPAMVTGAAAGTLCWRAATDAGLQPGAAAAFAMTGLAACLGPAVHAPLAAIAITIESTGYPLPPAGLFVAVALATIIMHTTTLFPSQPATTSRAVSCWRWVRGYPARLRDK